MGGRGSSYHRVIAPTPPPAAANDDANDAASAGATPPLGVTLAQLQGMDDQQLHDFLIKVQSVDIPAFLSDHHLQRMVYALGMNDKPEIVSQKQFDYETSFAGGHTAIYRTVNDTSVGGNTFTADDICDMLTDGDLTYHGAGMYGDGLYFSDSLSGSKAYGWNNPRTVGAYLNSKARPISFSKLQKEYDAFVKTHPQTRKALGFAKSHGSGHHNSYAQFALIRGYNVIYNARGGERYYSVLDRGVLSMTRKRY